MSPLPNDLTTCVYLKGTTFHEQPKSWQNFVLTHVPEPWAWLGFQKPIHKVCS